MKDSVRILIGATTLILFAALWSNNAYTQHGADAERGKQAFQKRCSGCHAMDQEREGPRLRGVIGRRAGSVSGFKYSAALSSSKVVWDSSSLDKWLADPDSFIADNDMAYHVPNAGERADIIRFLSQSSSQ